MPVNYVSVCCFKNKFWGNNDSLKQLKIQGLIRGFEKGVTVLKTPEMYKAIKTHMFID